MTPAGTSGTKKSLDASELLKRLEAQENEAFKKFQDDQKAKREKALAAVVEPLRSERAEQVAAWTAAGDRIKEIDRQIDKLLDRKTGHAPDRKGGKRTRMSEAQVIEAADAIGSAVHRAGDDGLSFKELTEKVTKLPGGKRGKALAELVNSKNSNGKKIKMKGDKAAARYYAA